MPCYYLEVYSPAAPPRRYALPSSRCSIGTADSADLTLPNPGTTAAALLVAAVVGTGMALRATPSSELGLRFGGAEYREVMVPWGDDVFVGTLRLRFCRELSTIHPMLHAMALIASALSLIGGVVVAQRWQSELAIAPASKPPSMDAPISACPDKEPEVAAYRAADALRRGYAKKARFPFSAREGGAALSLFAQAEACFAVCGNHAEAEIASAEHDAWLAKLDSRVRTLSITLDRAIAEKNYHRALQVDLALRELLYAQRQESFVKSLFSLESRLRRQIADQRVVIHFGTATSR